MHAIDVTNVIQFLPVILNQLFEVLLCIRNDDVSVNVIRYSFFMISCLKSPIKALLTLFRVCEISPFLHTFTKTNVEFPWEFLVIP